MAAPVASTGLLVSVAAPRPSATVEAADRKQLVVRAGAGTPAARTALPVVWGPGVSAASPTVVGGAAAITGAAVVAAAQKCRRKPVVAAVAARAWRRSARSSGP